MASRRASSPSWSRAALFVFKGALVYHVFSHYVGSFGRTYGISMLPTIPDGQRKRSWILMSALHRRGRWIKVGDVVTYTHPIFPGEYGCKRVIGMPGDFVSVVTPGRGDGEVRDVDVEGKWARVTEQVVQVPEGHCWVTGDNLEWSRDSRLYGPLPLGLVKSKVLAVVAPFRDAKWLGADMDVKDAQGMEHDWVTK